MCIQSFIFLKYVFLAFHFYLVNFDLFYLDWLSMVLALACPTSCANVLKILNFMISFYFLATKCIRKKRKI